MSNFRPLVNEVRVCRVLQEHSGPTKICFQCVTTGDLFTSGGSERWCDKRYAAIEAFVNRYGTFLVKFDVHMATTTGSIDANHFGDAPIDWISI